ncbi:MAG TPA: hypothetical protein VFB54_19865 [Burkholderiales bacterium]|nr:hypothetical protein [Burkholderiales bacterium]
MNIRAIQTRRREPRLTEPRALPHAECPIEQRFGSDDPVVQQQLMQQAAQGTREVGHTVFVADYNGLRVLAGSEVALESAAAALRRRFGTALVVEPAAVRYADRVPVLEPYMIVLVNAPDTCLGRVRNDFERRHGHITRIAGRGRFVLEGEAPLAELLGYHHHMRDMLAEHWDESHVATWLNRYVPIDDNGPEVA